ncbi:MAG TPA: bifunctional oligoribonuclease/PAP phosphatase NrnA [Thermoanaerobaculia bacterium]|nr:bifunctional oligoribonuclease/PAP phosphatase NrnA [Thermoanaerobaculia bacterium]
MSVSLPDALLNKVRTGSRFLLTSHANPDGDAIGSELGLARVLADLGKEALIWNRDPVPGLYRPMPGSAAIHVGEEPPAGFPTAFEAVVVLECPSLDRTGLEGALARHPNLLNIDHHLGNDGYGEVAWVDPEAPAVGEMVFRLARGLGVAPDVDTATCLLLALVTDTGGFRFANATPAAFRAGAALVEAGARPEEVSRWLYESNPPAMVRLLGEMLATLQLHAHGRIASVLLTRAMFERAGAAPGDSEGLIDVPRSIAGVEAAALLRERGEQRFKVSLRSRGAVDVQAVASRHGGGGHKNAAGCELTGPAEAIREQVVAELGQALEEGRG